MPANIRTQRSKESNYKDKGPAGSVKRRNLITGALALLIFLFFFNFFQLLLMPKYMNEIPEGALIAEYYSNKGDNDVIFIGDCEAYESVSPVTLWEHYGITSCIIGSAQQLVWQSYYLLEEILRYEKPQVVVFNVLALQYNEPQREAYNRMNIDGMRLGLPKIKSALASKLPEETLLSYLLPILRYHSRWQEISSEDFKYLLKRDKISHNGYLMRVDARPVTSIPQARKLADYSFGENSICYLDKMTELCSDNNIELVLMKAPSLYPHWYEEWDQQIAAYAQQHNLKYLNYLELADEIALDYGQDTYDGGLHLNLSGAEKLSLHLGGKLQDMKVPDRRDQQNIAKAWEEKVDFYYKMKQAQYDDLAQYGYLKNFGGRAPELVEEKTEED